MARVTVTELAAALEQLRAQMAEISRRMAVLEGKGETAEPAAAPEEPAAAGIGEEELLAIAAAIGAFLGVKAHIRHIRLISTSAWAQQGRVSIQASHRLGS